MPIDVESTDLSKNPHCIHGPTILFSRVVNGEKRKFFACAACRDRKDCTFFAWENDVHTLKKCKEKLLKQRNKYVGDVNHIKLFLTLNEIKNMPQSRRLYCRTCCSFQLPKFEAKHADHKTTRDVSDYSLCHPTEFLEPLDNVKMEAQFLFSKLAVETIVKMLSQLKIKNVLCIGAPRIHEYILNEVPTMSTLLLDIDKRYHNFYGPLEFCWYNSFNNHFFLPEAENTFKEFLKTDCADNFVVLTDPPFGGRVEPLAHSLKEINSLFKLLNKTDEHLQIMWTFPYFMEPQILNSLPDFTMLDYKVDYENHPLFRDGPKGRKQGSPVRIFTNINPRTIKLPPEQGYKFCKKCDRWVANENKHCELCKCCTSKDGRTYVHCNLCERCVKPTWKHCDTCNRCAQIDHKCGSVTFNQECFHCKEIGHKKGECPKVDHEDIKRRRKDGLKSKQRKRRKFN